MKNYFFISLLLMSVACNPQRQKEIIEAESQRDQLYSEVMAVHDEVMPHMQNIRRYKGQIRDKIESMAKEGVTKSQEVQVLNNLIGQLESADDAMMNWMRAFGSRDYAKMEESEALAYLNDQRDKIVKVKEEMETAMRQAEEALK
jgi:flagellar biosynthesis chaperone FliJ